MKSKTKFIELLYSKFKNKQFSAKQMINCYLIYNPTSINPYYSGETACYRQKSKISGYTLLNWKRNAYQFISLELFKISANSLNSYFWHYLKPESEKLIRLREIAKNNPEYAEFCDFLIEFQTDTTDFLKSLESQNKPKIEGNCELCDFKANCGKKNDKLNPDLEDCRNMNGIKTD